MNKKELFELLKSAHQQMCDWWSKEVDFNGGIMAPCSFHIFLEYLLTFPEKTYWDRWIGDKIPEDKKPFFKEFILTLILSHYTKIEVYE